MVFSGSSEFVMLLRAVIEAVLMRIQQALSVNAQGVVNSSCVLRFEL